MKSGATLLAPASEGERGHCGEETGWAAFAIADVLLLPSQQTNGDSVVSAECAHASADERDGR